MPCQHRTCTGGSNLMLGSGKVLLQTERLRHRKCVLVRANEHRIGVCHLRTLGCTQCLCNTMKMVTAALFKSLSHIFLLASESFKNSLPPISGSQLIPSRCSTAASAEKYPPARQNSSASWCTMSLTRLL